MQTLSSTVRRYPAVWLAPPETKKTTGRTEGETTYRLTLHLMTMPANGLNDEHWAEMERCALGMAAEIASQPEVCSIANVACTPARQSLTAHGESSLTLQCDITVWYIIND